MNVPLDADLHQLDVEQLRVLLEVSCTVRAMVGDGSPLVLILDRVKRDLGARPHIPPAAQIVMITYLAQIAIRHSLAVGEAAKTTD